MKRFSLKPWSCSLFAVLFVYTSVLADEAEQATAHDLVFELQCSITKVEASSVNGETSLTDDIGIYDEQGRPTSVSGVYTFFTDAKMEIGGMAFRFDRDGPTWDGKPTPPKPERVEALMYPRVTTLPGQSGEVSIETHKPMQYMRRVRGDRFELDRVVMPTGVTIKHTSDTGRRGRVRVDPFVISIKTVQHREPIKGVDLNIGKPILTEDKAELALSLESGRTYGILWRTETQGLLLLTVKVTEVRPQPEGG